MLDPTTADDAPDTHVVRWIEKGHRRAFPTHEAIEVLAIARVAAQKAMIAELPKIFRPADHLSRLPGAVHGVGRIRAVLLEIADDLVDFDGLEARDRNVQLFIDEELSQLGQLNGKAFPIPARVLGNLIVGKQQGTLFRFAQPFQHDHWYLAEAKKFCGRKATVSRDDHRVLVDQQRDREAVGDDAVGDLADLLLRMRPCVTWIGFEFVRRN